ncbi:DUF4256 domain-containing protein [Pedobacter sp. Leaf194]|uniref:DUF4256 domain-containing protein n=1 Tax=Pedobacter sp. Leaf194 TaxID=1736297 RepID=UPI000702DDB5|nr:DUF4256 domain-containing protein [Pedobacter sp. Leaf194]KQS36007.1 hypothetical protein ASG14_11230 [Pedobacter sp. Leaf194]
MKKLTAEQQENLTNILKLRFEQNMNRHKDVAWNDVETKLKINNDKLWSLNEMEITGGEPDILDYDAATNEFVFFDCAVESPKNRRSFCYDGKALESRKENKPKNNVIDVAGEMGIELLDEKNYRYLQEFGAFDTKTSSWILSPPNIRALGGALFGDRRYNQVFIYHNGAESYYAARGFRGLLRV